MGKSVFKSIKDIKDIKSKKITNGIFYSLIAILLFIFGIIQSNIFEILCGLIFIIEILNLVKEYFFQVHEILNEDLIYVQDINFILLCNYLYKEIKKNELLTAQVNHKLILLADKMEEDLCN